jgi:hypothetical protein
MEPLDLKMLDEADRIGTFYPKADHEKQRAPQLAEHGYLRAVRRSVQATGMPSPPIGYEITAEGKAALRSTH